MSGIPRPADLASHSDLIGRGKVARLFRSVVRKSCMRRRVERKGDLSGANGFSKTWWDYMWVNEPALEKNRDLQFKTIGEIAKMTNKRVIDAFLDLVVEEISTRVPAGREQHRR